MNQTHLRFTFLSMLKEFLMNTFNFSLYNVYTTNNNLLLGNAIKDSFCLGYDAIIVSEAKISIAQNPRTKISSIYIEFVDTSGNIKKEKVTKLNKNFFVIDPLHYKTELLVCVSKTILEDSFKNYFKENKEKIAEALSNTNIVQKDISDLITE